MKVLSFGSINIDHVYSVAHFVKKGETLSSDMMQDFAGGKGLNQSIALAKAGVETWHAGCVGKDGQHLVDMMKNSGVNTSLIRVVQDIPTGHAIIQTDKTGDNCIILYGGANQKISTEYIDLVFSYFEYGDYLVIQNEINNLPYIVKKAYEKGLKIILNPSPMNQKIFAIPLEKVNMLILNEIEAAQLLEEDESDSEIIMKKLSTRFPNTDIVLTLGSQGSVYYEGKNGKITKQECFRTDVVDTTAAGDTYTGFLLSSLCKGNTIKASMERASRAASIAISRKGASVSIPDCHEVD